MRAACASISGRTLPSPGVRPRRLRAGPGTVGCRPVPVRVVRRSGHATSGLTICNRCLWTYLQAMMYK